MYRCSLSVLIDAKREKKFALWYSIVKNWFFCESEVSIILGKDISFQMECLNLIIINTISHWVVVLQYCLEPLAYIMALLWWALHDYIKRQSQPWKNLYSKQRGKTTSLQKGYNVKLDNWEWDWRHREIEWLGLSYPGSLWMNCKLNTELLS